MKLFLFLSSLCLAHAAKLETRGEELPEGAHDKVTRQEVLEKMNTARGAIWHFKGMVHELVDALLRPKGSGDDAFWTMAEKAAEVMKTGGGIYYHSLKDVDEMLTRMFVAGSEFRPPIGCFNAFFMHKYHEDFGTDYNLDEMMIALAKDLTCIESRLQDIHDNGGEYTVGCDLSEVDIVRGLTDVIADTFRLKDEGWALHHTISMVLQKHHPGAFDVYAHGTQMEERSKLQSDDLIERLLRALKNQEAKKQTKK